MILLGQRVETNNFIFLFTLLFNQIKVISYIQCLISEKQTVN
jgi:hypothetical protein